MSKKIINSIISADDWNTIVNKAYNKSYCIQEQYDLIEYYRIGVTPSEIVEDKFLDNDNIEYILDNGLEGLNFKVWEIFNIQDVREKYRFSDLEMYNILKKQLYPDLYVLATDLYNKGIIDEEDFFISLIPHITQYNFLHGLKNKTIQQ